MDSTNAKEWNVKDHEVQDHAEGDSCDEVRVGPDRQHQETFVLAERVAGVEHFDDWEEHVNISIVRSREAIEPTLTDKNRERHGRGGFGVIVREHGATDLREIGRAFVEMSLSQADTGQQSNAVTMRPYVAHQLVERDLGTSLVEHEPPSITEDCRAPYVDADNHVTEEQPGSNERFTA